MRNHDCLHDSINKPKVCAGSWTCEECGKRWGDAGVFPGNYWEPLCGYYLCHELGTKCPNCCPPDEDLEKKERAELARLKAKYEQ